ncbi:MAG TPA: hypothetical protein VG737_07510 [Cyclobacteriaceae bacterium]|nr:hypothetical protein [Cyclobacteriaceae bacterium]
MKNILNVLGWVFLGALFLFLGYLLLAQKQQYEHTERTLNAQIARAEMQHCQAIEVQEGKEVKTLREKIWNGLQSAAAFCISIFTKL